MPASDPRRPAAGTVRRTQSPTKEKATLTKPMTIIVAMPTCHDTMAASSSLNPSPRAAR